MSHLTTTKAIREPVTTRTIAQIDRDIDANRRELQGRVQMRRSADAACWQQAWERHPELCRRDHELFRERGFAQLERDQKAAKILARTPRTKKPKQCPTCGAHTLVAS